MFVEIQHTSNPWKPEQQKNIIQGLCESIRPDGSYGFDGPGPVATEQGSRIRLWKLLREMDVPPVFLLHMEEELYRLGKNAKLLTNAKSKHIEKCHYHLIKEMLEKAICRCKECA